MMLDTWGAWVAVASLLSIVPLALAWLVSSALIRQRPSVRHHVWVVAITIALLAPATRVVSPRIDLPLLTTSTPIPEMTIAVPDALRADVAPQSSRSTDGPSGESRSPWSSTTIFAVVWLAGAVPLALLCALRRARLARIVATAVAWDETPRVRAHEAVVVPMLAGVRNPIILLPLAATEWPAQELEAVLAHERAHLARRDHVTTLICDAAIAVYWLNPLVWIAAAALEHERERACDEEVLRAGVKPSVYATALLRIAEGLPRQSRFTGAPAISGGRVDARIRSVLADAPRSGLVPLSWPTTAALVVSCALIVGGVHVVARSSPGQSPGSTQGAGGAVTVLGEVRMPARIAIAGTKSLLETLVEAGGPTDEASAEVEVVHPSGTRTVVDARDLQAVRAFLLRPGDVVLVARSRASTPATAQTSQSRPAAPRTDLAAQRVSGSITVQGEVRSGTITLAVTGSKSLLEALAEAGGLTQQAGSDLDVVHPDGTHKVIDLRDIAAVYAYPLHAGDSVTVRALAQSGSNGAKPWIVVRGPDALGRGPLRASFLPRDTPYFQGGPSVGLPAPREDLRLSDGLIISGFEFIGWAEGDSTRVMVFALVPSKGSPNTYRPGRSESLERRDFANYRLPKNQTAPVSIVEMTDLGVEPFTVSSEPAPPDRR